MSALIASWGVVRASCRRGSSFGWSCCPSTSPLHVKMVVADARLLMRWQINQLIRCPPRPICLARGWPGHRPACLHRLACYRQFLQCRLERTGCANANDPTRAASSHVFGLEPAAPKAMAGSLAGLLDPDIPLAFRFLRQAFSRRAIGVPMRVPS